MTPRRKARQAEALALTSSASMTIELRIRLNPIQIIYAAPKIISGVKRTGMMVARRAMPMAP